MMKNEIIYIKIISLLILYISIPQFVIGQADEVNQSVFKLNGEWLFKTDMYNKGIEKNWYLQDINTSDRDQMDGYNLTWSVNDKEGKIIEGDFLELPVIRPGDDSIKKTINWELTEGKKLRVNLLDPQNYSIRDTTIYFSPPHPPEVVSVHTASDQIRILLDDLSGTVDYEFTVQSVNEYGVSEPTWVK